ncbi:MAG: hypothetical protein WC877_03355 [Dehalococcoidales bacterium]|jgi:hypothetical protein|nr:hypothetical protein [Candidatus Neomarinimicrobiota bacterium]
MKKKIVNTDIQDAPRNKLSFSKKKGERVVIGMTTVNGVNYKIEIGEYKLRGILDWLAVAIKEISIENHLKAKTRLKKIKLSQLMGNLNA